MADQPIHAPTDFNTTLRKLEITDPAHADTFNPLFERLVNNDAYLQETKVDKTDVAASGANKIPRLDAQGKGAFSITGDAASIGGQTLSQLDGRYSPAAHVGSGGNAHALATTTAAGFMGPEDKQRLTDYNEYASGKDTNGIYTVMEYKRTDGTLYLKSTLSNPDASGNYQTMTWQFYDAAGTSVLSTKTWTLTYDADGKIVSKVAS